MEDAGKTMLLGELAAQDSDNVDGSVYLSADEADADAETTEADHNGELSESLLEAEEDGTIIAGTEDEIPEGIIEDTHEGYILSSETGEHQDDVEMSTTTQDTLESTNDPADDTQVASLEGTGESLEDPDDPPATHEDFSGDQFISPTNALIVQNEPPHQLMEEADTPGEEQSGEVDAHADADNDEGLFSFADNNSGDAMAGHEDELDNHDDDLLQSSGSADPEASIEEEEDDEDSQLADSTDTAAELSSENLAGTTGDTMELPLEDNEAGTSNNTEGFSFLAGGNHIEGSLGGLEGKLVVGSDGTVHLLAGQDSLQGIQLMEGDDKPEGHANGDDDNVAQLQQDIELQLHEALMKQEEIKQEEEERSIEQNETPADQANAGGDALATLASAALDHQSPANGVKSEPSVPEVKSEPDSNEPQWMDVGICKGTHCVVRTYYIPNENQSWDKNWDGITTATLPDHRALAKLELEAGKAYKFRVAAINSCGRGPWSEISAFRTSMPGVPGAPSAIKISKTVEGAHISWEPPSAASGVIEDYTVYMAVRSTTHDSQVVSSGAGQLAFVRIYQGAENQCSVGFDTLTEAHIDTTTKPAILFRIAARNEKGLGPAIQVRWLQDGVAPNSAKPQAPGAVRRVGGEIKPHTSIKRKKSEFFP